MTSTLQALKAKSAARLMEEKKTLDRKRELLILTLNFLVDQGFIATAEQLQHEAGVSLSKFQVADNIDLSLVFQHFLEYYEMRFGRAPKVVRKSSTEEANAKKSLLRNGSNKSMSTTKASSKRIATSKDRREENSDVAAEVPEATETQSSFQVNGKAMKNQREQENEEGERPDQRLLKPLSLFLDGTSSETRDLALMISRDIFTENPNVRWNDVVGLENAKQLLKEAMVIPAKYPELFAGGLLSPWKGVLLYGPPGTGKTMLAKAVATECRTTFFNISASTIVSKYRGDSEKLVRILFDLARYHAPSTIFLDEIDSIMGQRGGAGNEHEASRRMKTELLIQMDGLARNHDPSCQVFILAASNLPWELDMALLRRLEKRVLVDLPGEHVRKAVFQKQLPPNDSRVDTIDYDHLAQNTDGYSCADICLVCKEAAMFPVRRLMSALEKFDNLGRPPPKDVVLGAVTNQDAVQALARTRPASLLRKNDAYTKWQADFGSD